MTKHTIKIELPDGWEPVDDLIPSCIRKGEWLDVSLRIRQSWQWPEWLTAEWIVQNSSGNWWYSGEEPKLIGDSGWCFSGGGNLSLTTFVPPPCTDWRTSKRRNPQSNQP